MKIYIAARFSRRSECNNIANALKKFGHTITSRWVLPQLHDIPPSELSEQAEDSERARFAREDVEDVIACDWFICLMDLARSNGRGGKHVEFGMALGLGKRVTIIGPRETVFHHLSQIECFENVNNFYRCHLTTFGGGE